MIEVKQKDKISLIFTPNIDIGEANITFKILNFANESIYEGVGAIVNGDIVTEPVDFSDIDNGLYEIQIYCETTTERKVIHEFLKVEK